MGLSIWHILVVLLVVLIVFGAGKLPRVMGDLGKGVRSFRDGLKSEDEANHAPEQPKRVGTDAPDVKRERDANHS